MQFIIEVTYARVGWFWRSTYCYRQCIECKNETIALYLRFLVSVRLRQVSTVQRETKRRRRKRGNSFCCPRLPCNTHEKMISFFKKLLSISVEIDLLWIIAYMAQIFGLQSSWKNPPLLFINLCCNSAFRPSTRISVSVLVYAFTSYELRCFSATLSFLLHKQL